MPRTIRVAHSPDSDDAFMFYGLASGAVDTGDLELVHELQDIESLNRRALAGELEVTAVSIHAYAYLADKYILLPHGASMGEGYGPRLVAKEPLEREDLAGKKIAVPGTMTSAYLALKMYFPEAETVVVPFDQINDHVQDGSVDVGLIIHEGQLTYKEEGLHLIADMGVWWGEQTGGLPMPLGGNVIRRDLGEDVIRNTSKYLRESIAYSLDNRKEALEYAIQFGRGLDAEQCDEFVGMYVNPRTLDYGEDGRRSVQLFLDRGYEEGLIPHRIEVEFAE